MVRNTTKQCTGCRQNLSTKRFGKNSGRKDGLQNYCRDCKRAQNLEKSRKHRSKIAFYKESHPCQDCGGYFPACVMDFDHRVDKTYGVAKMAVYSWKRIQEEIDKCDLVCANCHRIRTHGHRIP